MDTPICAEGEGIVAAYDPTRVANKIGTFAIQTCVAVIIYNPNTRVGAVLHFPSELELEARLDDVLLNDARFSHDHNDLKVTLVGGSSSWDCCFGSANIWQTINSYLDSIDIAYKHKDYSLFGVLSNTYCVLLDLETGGVAVSKKQSDNDVLLNYYQTSLNSTTRGRQRLRELADYMENDIPQNRAVRLYQL